MSVTHKKIAAKLNVSCSLVGRALRGDTAVAERTRERVAAAARDMGYNLDSNREARALIARRYGQRLKNGVAAIVFCPSPDVSIRSLPYSESIVQGMEEKATELGLDVCYCPARDDEVPRLVRDRSVDGVVVLGYYADYVQEIRELGLPVVTFATRWDIANSVTSDDYHGGYAATQHLLELGHRCIAYLGPFATDGHAGRERVRGYRAAMAEYGLTVPPEWINMEFIGPTATPTRYCVGCGKCAACIGWPALLAANGGLGESRELPFTGLVCYSDAIAMASVDHIRSHGFDVPRDISVTGFDNISRHYGFEPELTSVDYDRHQMGRDIVRVLNEAIHQNEDEETQCHCIAPTSLVVNASTAAAEPALLLGEEVAR